jgi:peptide/nickel transport system substrate-binding protein
MLSLLVISMLISTHIPPSLAQPRYGGTLVVGVSSEPPGLTLAGPPTWVYQQSIALVSNSLIAFNPQNLEWMPELAQSWEIKIAEGTMSIKFNLVRNATWHDGRPFTSADVKFTYEGPGPVLNSFLMTFKKDYLEAIETPDDYTVIFRIKGTWTGVLFPGIFGGAGTGIMPKHLYEGTDYTTNPHNAAPIGTGPFKFKEWKKGEYIIYERNEKYWKKGLPYLDRIIFRIIPDATAMATAFEKGTIDFIWNYGLLFTDAMRLQNDIGLGKLVGKRVWFFPSPGASVDVLGFNQHPDGPPPFKDARVRRAIAAAIDRQAIADIAYYGRTKAMDTILSTAPAVSIYYDPTLKQQEYNPSLAEKLLDEAGYPRGRDGVRFSTSITIDPVAYPWHLKEAELIRDFLDKVGIKVKIITLDTAAWHETVFKGWKFEMTIFPYVQGPGVAFLVRYFTGKGIARASWSNAHGYNNTEVNRLLYAAEFEMDKAKHVELVRQALRILNQDQAAVWTVERNFVAAVNLDFSDELQPGVWEHAWGTSYMRPERIYWLKAPLKVEVPVEKPVEKIVEKPVEVPYVPSWMYAPTIVAIIVALSAVAYAIRVRRMRPK